VCRSRRSYDSCDARPVRNNFLRMQPQGNQNTHICLEEKRRCAGTEQRKQLARKVPDQLHSNATQTHRDRLYPARACETVKGSFGSKKARPEPVRVIATRILNAREYHPNRSHAWVRRIDRTRAKLWIGSRTQTIFVIVEFSPSRIDFSRTHALAVDSSRGGQLHFSCYDRVDGVAVLWVAMSAPLIA
jgi:hypothetical protein